jgi:hypothetical protein
MGVFRPIIQPALPLVLHRGHDFGLRRRIAAQLVGDDGTWDVLKAFQQLAKELLRGFKSAGHAQRFLSIFGLVADLFSIGRHLLSAPNYRAALSRRFVEWRSIAGVPAAA